MEKEAKATPKHQHPHHPLTPLHRSPKPGGKAAPGKRKPGPGGASGDVSVPCDNCRPSPREKISVVPLDYQSGGHLMNRRLSMPSPNGLLRTIVSPFIPRKSPVNPQIEDDRQYWQAALAELTNKLIETTRSRDEALLEASRLKHSMIALEKKLNRLEVYCHSLKSGLERQSHSTTSNASPYRTLHIDDKLIEQHFLVAVSEARNHVRALSRLLISQFPHMGLEVHEAIFALLRPYDIKVSLASTNPGTLVLYLEALLNGSFFEDFESAGFHKDAATLSMILNPTEKCKVNFDNFTALKAMTWQGVLDNGTKHFSEEFSKFCDRKMSEVARMLEWNSAWSEQLLEAFFGASKSVWLVHPGFSIFRTGNGAGFDPVYMEDAGSSRVPRAGAATVRVMVAPGFYVNSNAVKCKVLCRHNNRRPGNIKDDSIGR